MQEGKIPEREQMLAIKGIGVITVAEFLAEVGDVRRFESPRQYKSWKEQKNFINIESQTYKEIVAFTERKKLDELHKAVEVGKRPYQNILKVIISAGVTAMICFLIGVLMHLFLN